MFTLKVIVTTNAKIWLQDNPLENCIKNSANLQCVMEKKFYLLKVIFYYLKNFLLYFKRI